MTNEIYGKPTIEDDCVVKVIDHVIHEKKRMRAGESLEDIDPEKLSQDGKDSDAEMKEEPSTPIKEETKSDVDTTPQKPSPEKDEPMSDADDDKKKGIHIGFRSTMALRDMVTPVMKRLSNFEDTIKSFKMTGPKSLNRSPQLLLSSTSCQR